MKSDKKDDGQEDDSSTLAGDQKYRCFSGPASASSSLTSAKFLPQATSTPYKCQATTPLHTLFNSRPPKQDLSVDAATGLTIRQPRVRFRDEQGGELFDVHGREPTTIQDRSASQPSQQESLHQTPSYNDGPRFAEVMESIEMEPHVTPSHTPIFPLSARDTHHKEAVHVNHPEPIYPPMSTNVSRWSDAFHDDYSKTRPAVTVVGVQTDSSSSTDASDKTATTATDEEARMEADYLAKRALYRAKLRDAIGKGREVDASAHDVGVAIDAKKQQLAETMRGVEDKFQAVIEKRKKLQQTRQAPPRKECR